MNRLSLSLALAKLQQDARPAELAGMARFGINIEQRLGLSMPAMRRHEFGRRAAFALLATLAVHDRLAGDERNYVKKAVNWALRNIGKRNPALNTAAIECARRIQQKGSRSARWIAADALRELTSAAVQARLR